MLNFVFCYNMQIRLIRDQGEQNWRLSLIRDTLHRAPTFLFLFVASFIWIYANWRYWWLQMEYLRLWVSSESELASALPSNFAHTNRSVFLSFWELYFSDFHLYFFDSQLEGCIRPPGRGVALQSVYTPRERRTFGENHLQPKACNWFNLGGFNVQFTNAKYESQCNDAKRSVFVSFQNFKIHKCQISIKLKSF